MAGSLNSIIRINKNGACTIPVSVRRLLRFTPGAKLKVDISDDKLIIKKCTEGK